MKPVKNGFHSSQPKTAARIILRNKKALEQVQICVGVPSHPIAHENRHASYILNTLLGGGMSSRLFQNIRERQGLAYAIYSDLSPYRDTGCLSVYAGTSRESASKVVQSVVSEFRQLKEHEYGDRARGRCNGIGQALKSSISGTAASSCLLPAVCSICRKHAGFHGRSGAKAHRARIHLFQRLLVTQNDAGRRLGL